MKLKKKMLLDLIMAIIMVMLLRYKWTGGLIHEILGVVILAGFLLHMIGNKFYVSVVKKRKAEQWRQWKNPAGLILNILLLIDTVVMLVSSLGISRDLFGFISSGIGNYAFWRLLHVSCAYMMIVIVAFHVLLHWKLIGGFIRNQLLKKVKMPVVWNNMMRVIAMVMVVIILKVSFDNVMNSIHIFDMELAYQKKDYNIQVETEVAAVTVTPTSIPVETTVEPTQAAEETVEETPQEIIETEVPQESLEDYLGKLTCSGCGRHCSLLAPSCGTGRAQALEATEAYGM